MVCRSSYLRKKTIIRTRLPLGRSGSDYIGLVRVTGLEPARLATEEPKSTESTNSTTPACENILSQRVCGVNVRTVGGIVIFPRKNGVGLACGAAGVRRTLEKRLGNGRKKDLETFQTVVKLLCFSTRKGKGFYDKCRKFNFWIFFSCFSGGAVV